MMWEIEPFWTVFAPHYFASGNTTKNLKEDLRRTLSRWSPDYLAAIDELLEPVAYQHYLNQKTWEARAATQEALT